MKYNPSLPDVHMEDECPLANMGALGLLVTSGLGSIGLLVSSVIIRRLVRRASIKNNSAPVPDSPPPQTSHHAAEPQTTPDHPAPPDQCNTIEPHDKKVFRSDSQPTQSQPTVTACSPSQGIESNCNDSPSTDTEVVGKNSTTGDVLPHSRAAVKRTQKKVEKYNRDNKIEHATPYSHRLEHGEPVVKAVFSKSELPQTTEAYHVTKPIELSFRRDERNMELSFEMYGPPTKKAVRGTVNSDTRRRKVDITEVKMAVTTVTNPPGIVKGVGTNMQALRVPPRPTIPQPERVEYAPKRRESSLQTSNAAVSDVSEEIQTPSDVEIVMLPTEPRNDTPRQVDVPESIPTTAPKTTNVTWEEDVIEQVEHSKPLQAVVAMEEKTDTEKILRSSKALSDLGPRSRKRLSQRRLFPSILKGKKEVSEGKQTGEMGQELSRKSSAETVADHGKLRRFGSRRQSNATDGRQPMRIVRISELIKRRFDKNVRSYKQ